MSNELTALLGKVAELQGRATEISNRIRQDVLSFVKVQEELSDAFGNLARVLQAELSRPSPALSPALVSKGPRILRIPDVIERTGLRRSTVWKFVKDGTFPHPRRLGIRAVGWRDSEVAEWVSTRKTSNELGPRSPRGRRQQRQS